MNYNPGYNIFKFYVLVQVHVATSKTRVDI